ncbi:MAG: ferritin family protein [Bacillota bacterium]
MSGCLNIGDMGQLVKNFVMTLPCHAQNPYPSAMMPAHNVRIATLLLNAFGSSASEMTAVAQYIHHHLTIEEKDVANMELCIALVEMFHMEMIGEMIESLGGNPKYRNPNKFYWTGGNVGYGDTLCSKLSADILAEEEGIAGYESLIRDIRDVDGPAATYVIECIERIIEDERSHLYCFKSAYNKYCDKCHRDTDNQDAMGDIPLAAQGKDDELSQDVPDKTI